MKRVHSDIEIDNELLHQCKTRLFGQLNTLENENESVSEAERKLKGLHFINFTWNLWIFIALLDTSFLQKVSGSIFIVGKVQFFIFIITWRKGRTDLAGRKWLKNYSITIRHLSMSEYRLRRLMETLAIQIMKPWARLLTSSVFARLLMILIWQ